MSDEPNPITDDLFETVVLGGVESPGVCKLSGHDRKVDWDVKAANGQIGASTTLKGVPLVEFTLTLFLADEDDFNDWPPFRTQLLSTIAGSKPKALEVEHPDLAANNITSVVLSSIGGVQHDGKGGRTIVIKLQEYKPPKKKGGSPTGSGLKAGDGDPNAAAKSEIAQLTAQYKATPWS